MGGAPGGFVQSRGAKEKGPPAVFEMGGGGADEFCVAAENRPAAECRAGAGSGVGLTVEKRPPSTIQMGGGGTAKLDAGGGKKPVLGLTTI